MRRRVTQLARVGYWFLFLVVGSVLGRAAQAQDAMPLSQGRVGTSYSAELKTEGGLAPLKWHLSGGQLPPGLNVSQAGKIEGTPTAASSQPFTFEMTVSDSSQPPQLAAQRFSIAIAAPPLRIVGSASATGSAPLKIVGATGSSVPDDAAATAASAAAPPSPSSGTVGTATANAASLSSAHPSGTTSPQPQGSSQGDPKQDPPNPICAPNSATIGHCGGQFLRTIVGFEQSGVSAAASKQSFFFDLLYDRPLGFKMDDDLGPSLRSWGNLRISSVPQQINSGVAQFAADFAQKVGDVKVNEVAQSFEFLGGLQYRLFAGAAKPTYFGGPDSGIRHRVSINAILGGGVITPLSPQDSVQIFNVPSNQPKFLDAYPDAKNKTFVAFTLQDRNRFFRQGYGGLRLMTHYLGDASRVRPPETFDLTYGFNESVTGGHIHGGVLRLEGFVPIPYSATSWIYFFGTGIFKPAGHAATSSPFLLDKAPDGTLPTDMSAVVIPTPQHDRDYYRIGVGIDFVDLVKMIQTSRAAKKAEAAKKAAETATTPTGTPK